MKKMGIEQMEMVEGGVSGQDVTYYMCGAALMLAVIPGAAPLAAGPAVGCATGLYAIFCVW